MYDFRRIMVGLDFTLMDRAILEYLDMICDKIKPLKIYFTHIHRNLSVPDYIVKEFPQFREPLDEKMKKEMQEKVERFFPKVNKYDVEYEVIEGSPLKELLHRIEVKNIDLLFMGRKDQLPGNGVVPRQVARSCKSSVWFIPESGKQTLSNIVVPIDFSDYSKLAMEEALKIAATQDNVNIYPLHLYDMPNFGAGVTYGKEKLEPMIRSNAVDTYNEFISTLNTDAYSIAPIFKLDPHYQGVKLVKEVVHQKNASLIIVGSQGKTGLKRWWLGSFTEKLIEANTDTPLLVIKSKIDRE